MEIVVPCCEFMGNAWRDGGKPTVSGQNAEHWQTLTRVSLTYK
jgi:hypothetical protein